MADLRKTYVDYDEKTGNILSTCRTANPDHPKIKRAKGRKVFECPPGVHNITGAVHKMNANRDGVEPRELTDLEALMQKYKHKDMVKNANNKTWINNMLRDLRNHKIVDKEVVKKK